MDILTAWLDENTREERAKIYHNIDPESITIVGLEMHFAHPGVYTPGGSMANMYGIPIRLCPYITTDKEQIKAYIAEHPGTINAGICVSEIEAAKKIAEREEGKVHVGDVVRVKGDEDELAVVTQTKGEYHFLLYSDGGHGGAYNSYIIKTGRTANVEGFLSFLKQIGGVE